MRKSGASSGSSPRCPWLACPTSWRMLGALRRGGWVTCVARGMTERRQHRWFLTRKAVDLLYATDHQHATHREQARAASDAPAQRSAAVTLAHTCRYCAATSPSPTTPPSASNGSWPETYTAPPALTTWLYMRGGGGKTPSGLAC